VGTVILTPSRTDALNDAENTAAVAIRIVRDPGERPDSVRIERGNPFTHIKLYEIDCELSWTGSANFSGGHIVIRDAAAPAKFKASSAYPTRHSPRLSLSTKSTL